MNKLTVITALLNFEESIFETKKSLMPLLVKDKAKWIIKYSKNTLPDELKKLINFSNNIKIIPKNDTSVYEGLNQGLDSVDTKYFLVLGSGDALTSKAEELINNYIYKYDFDAFFFSVLDLEHQIFKKPNLNLINKYPSLHHQGAIMNTENCKKLGGFDTSYKIAADYDLIARYIKIFKNVLCVNETLSNYKGFGISSLSNSANILTMLEIHLSKFKNFKIDSKEFLESLKKTIDLRLNILEKLKYNP